MPSNKRKINEMLYDIRREIANTQQNTPEHRELLLKYNYYCNKIRNDGYRIGYNEAFKRYINQHLSLICAFTAIGTLLGSFGGLLLLNTIPTVKITIPNSVFFVGAIGGILGAIFVYWSINKMLSFRRKQGK